MLWQSLATFALLTWGSEGKGCLFLVFFDSTFVSNQVIWCHFYKAFTIWHLFKDFANFVFAENAKNISCTEPIWMKLKLKSK